MKKIISQISLILLVILTGLVSTFTENVYAADSMAGINCVTSVQEGDDFTVALIIPESSAFGIQADITLKYSDGTSTTQTLIYMGSYGDKSVTFNAKVAGQATVTATNIIVTNENSEILEQGKTKSHTLTIVAKQNETPPSNSNDSGTSNNSGTGGTNSSTGTDSSNDSSSNNAGDTNTNTPPAQTTPNFTTVSENVYTTTSCNVRKSYSTDSEKIATISKGTKLTRTGVGDNGWSKVEYKGQTVYVYSQYLTTTNPEDSEKENEETEKTEEPKVEFKNTNENLYAKQNCNLRASWSTDSEKVGYLSKGDSVVRTGYADNGWSRIEYKGNTVYVASRLLVVEKPEESTETENTVDEETVVNETVNETNEENVLTEEEKLKLIAEEVGVLPEVGNNIANIIHSIITIIAIIGVLIGIYYLKKVK